MIDAKTKLCCVIGNPIAQSLSPQLHNNLYKVMGLNFAFLAFQVSDVEHAITGFKALNIVGISVTIPHKLEVMKYLDDIDETAKSIGAVNTIVNKEGKLMGTNTDWLGAVKALERKTRLAGKNIALLGAGGAARAVAYGLIKNRANVSIFNRSLEKAYELKNIFNLAGAYSLGDIDKIAEADIIINTTSIGMIPNDKMAPISEDCLNSKQIVFDIIHTPTETQLIKYAKKEKATVIYGYEMLLFGAAEQFELYTGKKAPIKLMEKILKGIK